MFIRNGSKKNKYIKLIITKLAMIKNFLVNKEEKGLIQIANKPHIKPEKPIIKKIIS